MGLLPVPTARVDEQLISLRGPFNCGHQPLVHGAASKVAVQSCDDLLFGAMRVRNEERLGELIRGLSPVEASEAQLWASGDETSK
jgi:hypothetical protein